MKAMVFTVCEAADHLLFLLLGGFDTALVTLFIFMVIELISSSIVAGVFPSPAKADSDSFHGLGARKCFCRKLMMLFFVLIAHRLDLVIGTGYIRDMLVIAFMVNELVSIVEKAGRMGLPLPEVMKSAIALLQRKGENPGD